MYIERANQCLDPFIVLIKNLVCRDGGCDKIQPSCTSRTAMGRWGTLKKWLKSGTALLVGLIVHLVFIRGYGYFWDEFYYLAATRRMDFGYLEFPAGIALIAALTRALLGESLLA
jgi:hypothetical protein